MVKAPCLISCGYPCKRLRTCLIQVGHFSEPSLFFFAFTLASRKRLVEEKRPCKIFLFLFTKIPHFYSKRDDTLSRLFLLTVR